MTPTYVAMFLSTASRLSLALGQGYFSRHAQSCTIPDFPRVLPISRQGSERGSCTLGRYLHHGIVLSTLPNQLRNHSKQGVRWQINMLRFPSPSCTRLPRDYLESIMHNAPMIIIRVMESTHVPIQHKILQATPSRVKSSPSLGSCSRKTE